MCLKSGFHGQNSMENCPYSEKFVFLSKKKNFNSKKAEIQLKSS